MVVLLEDDMHFIHTKKSPRDMITSTCWHMCTGLADIHDHIPSLQRPTVLPVHREIHVLMKNGNRAFCRGGVSIEDILEYFTNNGAVSSYYLNSYLEAAPREYTELDLSIAKKSCDNLRYKNA